MYGNQDRQDTIVQRRGAISGTVADKEYQGTATHDS